MGMNDLELYIRERQRWKRFLRKKQQLEQDAEKKDREGNGVRNGVEVE
jgi:hypothetical protein